MTPKPVNEFFDINKFPPKPGMIVMLISPSRISNAQSPEECFSVLNHFSPDKIIRPQVGMTFLYADTLYLHTETGGSEWKQKQQTLITAHKQGFMNLVESNKWFIPSAYSFLAWNQALLNTQNQFTGLLGTLQKHYEQDAAFQEFVHKDAKNLDRELDDQQLLFFLEEILLQYLIVKGKVRLPNQFVHGKQDWILLCYAGKPLYSQVYLHQKNFFGFENDQNEFQDALYDWQQNKLYRFDHVDLETVDL